MDRMSDFNVYGQLLTIGLVGLNDTVDRSSYFVIEKIQALAEILGARNEKIYDIRFNAKPVYVDGEQFILKINCYAKRWCEMGNNFQLEGEALPFDKDIDGSPPLSVCLPASQLQLAYFFSHLDENGGVIKILKEETLHYRDYVIMFFVPLPTDQCLAECEIVILREKKHRQLQIFSLDDP